MKKIFFFIALIMSASLSAQIKADWIHTLHTSESQKTQTQIHSVAYYADGSSLIIANYGSLATENVGYFAGGEFHGALYNVGNSYNKNVLIGKIDKEGKLLWAIHSEDGEIDGNQSVVTTTADGGAVAALKYRFSNRDDLQDGKEATLYKIIDAKGNVSKKEIKFPGKRIYQPVLVRINEDGEITKVVDMWCSTEKAALGTSLTSDAFAFKSAIEDENGNIFVAGYQYLDMAIGSDTIRARKQPTWDGDTQKDMHNSFILKLDQELSYVKHIITEGDLTGDGPSQIKLKDNRVIVVGYAKKKDARGSFSIGDKTIEIENQSVTTYSLSNNLEPLWVKGHAVISYPTDIKKRKWAKIDQVDLAADGTIYVTGGLQGAVVFNNDTLYSGGTKYSGWNDGFVFAIDSETGDWKAATICGSANLNLNTGSAIIGDTIYVTNYHLFQGEISQRLYTKDLKFIRKQILATGGGMSTSTNTAYHKRQVLVGLRANKKAVFNVLGTPIQKQTLWYNTLVAFHVADDSQVMTFTNPIITNRDKTTKIIKNGQVLIIKGNEAYNILGQKL